MKPETTDCSASIVPADPGAAVDKNGKAKVAAWSLPKPYHNIEQLCHTWVPHMIEGFQLQYLALGNVCSDLAKIAVVSPVLPARVSFDFVMISKGGRCENLTPRNPRGLIGRCLEVPGGYDIIVREATATTQGTYYNPWRSLGITTSTVMCSVTEIHLECDVSPPTPADPATSIPTVKGSTNY